MAQDFNALILEAKTKVYSNPANSLIVLAKMNSQVDFTLSLRPGAKAGDITADPEYKVQRRKRPTVNKVVNSNTGTSEAALAALDQFTKTDWETVEIGTGALKSVGFRRTFGDDYNFSNDPQHAKDMFYTVNEIAVQRSKDLNALLATSTKTGANLEAYVKGDTKVWDDISDLVIELAQVDDNFMDITSKEDFIIKVSQTVAKELTHEMGQAFLNETPIAQTGFKSGMGINGTPVIVDTRYTGRECVVFHKEVLAFKSESIKKDVSVDLGIAEFTGRFFYDVSAIIDTSRIKQFGENKPVTSQPK